MRDGSRIAVLGGEEDPGRFEFLRRAMREVRRLGREVGGLPRAARGAILRTDAPEATDAMIAERGEAGERMGRLSRDGLPRLEPLLAGPPELAGLAPDDLAVEAVAGRLTPAS